MGAQFIGVGTDGGVIDLQSLKCNDGCSDSVVIMELDELGGMVKMYNWVDWYEEEGEGGETVTVSCWLDGDTMEKAVGVTFTPGQALWVQGDTADQFVQSSGEVGTDDVAVQLRSGATLVGNGTPVAIDIQDIICNDGCSDSVVIMELDELGGMLKMYNWVDWYEQEGEGGETETVSCWLDGDTMEKAEGVTFAAGQGLWVQGDNTDQVITLPGVELN